MTNDQLAQFAASKVGGKAIATDAGPMISIPNHGLHFLSGADLMLKGMEVLCRSGCKWDATAYKWEMWKTGYPTSYAIQRFSHIEDTPLTFWKCWYKLEKGD